MRRSRWEVLLASVLLMAGVGCGSDGPERATVEGTVTYDGKTVDEGTIRFIPTEGTLGPTAGGKIEDGKFYISEEGGPVVGKQLVGIYGQRFTGRKVKAMPGTDILWDERVPMVPERFDKNPTLVVQVKSGKNEYSLELKSDQ